MGDVPCFEIFTLYYTVHGCNRIPELHYWDDLKNSSENPKVFLFISNIEILYYSTLLRNIILSVTDGGTTKFCYFFRFLFVHIVYIGIIFNSKM